MIHFTVSNSALEAPEHVEPGWKIWTTEFEEISASSFSFVFVLCKFHSRFTEQMSDFTTY